MTHHLCYFHSLQSTKHHHHSPHHRWSCVHCHYMSLLVITHVTTSIDNHRCNHQQINHRNHGFQVAPRTWRPSSALRWSPPALGRRAAASPRSVAPQQLLRGKFVACCSANDGSEAGDFRCLFLCSAGELAGRLVAGWLIMVHEPLNNAE